MLYNHDLVFLDLEWLTYKKRKYITQIGIVKLDKKNLSIKKQRLIKIKNHFFNNYQLGLIGAHTSCDKGYHTISKKIINEVYELLNNTDIYIYYDPLDVNNDDLKILLNQFSFEKTLNYNLTKVNTIWSLRHLYANYQKKQYLDNVFHNALEDAKMLKEVVLKEIKTINPKIPFYEYCCCYDLFGYYCLHKANLYKVLPEKPQITYQITNLILNEYSYFKFVPYNLFFKLYRYSFQLINLKTQQVYEFNNQNINLFIELVPNMLLIRDKVSENKLKMLLQTIFIQNKTFLILLTKNNKNN